MRLFLLLLLLGFFVPCASADEAPPWRGTLVVDQGTGPDTLTIRVVPGSFDLSRRRVTSWDEAQGLARRLCFKCGPESWGADESKRASWASALADRSYEPLADRVFLPMSVDLAGPVPLTGRLGWRAQPEDGVVLELDDGRSLTSEPGVQLPDPGNALARPEEAYEKVCRQMQLQVGGRTLFRADELAELAKRYPWYGTEPGNAFLIPFKVSQAPRDLLSHVVGVRVHIASRWLALESPARITASGSAAVSGTAAK